MTFLLAVESPGRKQQRDIREQSAFGLSAFQKLPESGSNRQCPTGSEAKGLARAQVASVSHTASTNSDFFLQSVASSSAAKDFGEL